MRAVLISELSRLEAAIYSVTDSHKMAELCVTYEVVKAELSALTGE